MDQAKELGQPAYCVFTDKTLLAIAEVRPSDAAELSQIAGVGARKLDRFGADVLALCTGEELGIPVQGGAQLPDGEPEEDPDPASDLLEKSSAEEAEK